MTDLSTQETTAYPSIMDIAYTVMANPASAKPADITRLASFVIDHPEHIAFYRRTSGAFQPNGALGRRMLGMQGFQRPTDDAAAAAAGQAQHAELGTGDLQADADAAEHPAG